MVILETIKTILTIVILGSCIITILIVVFQAGKSGGGLGSLFGGSGSQSVLGSRKADAIQKITAVFLGIFIIGSFLVAYLTKEIEKPKNKPDKAVEEVIDVKKSSSSDIDDKKEGLIVDKDAKTEDKIEDKKTDVEPKTDTDESKTTDEKDVEASAKTEDDKTDTGDNKTTTDEKTEDNNN